MYFGMMTGRGRKNREGPFFFITSNKWLSEIKEDGKKR